VDLVVQVRVRVLVQLWAVVQLVRQEEALQELVDPLWVGVQLFRLVESHVQLVLYQ